MWEKKEHKAQKQITMLVQKKHTIYTQLIKVIYD